MNWREIISVHVMWKQRLSAYLAGTSEEKPDPEVIRLDHLCPLGQWIDGEGKPMQNLPAYEEVRELHAKFHQNAAEVVMLHQSDCTAEAETLLNGPQSRLSENLKHRILGLSHQVNAGTSGVFQS
ncbi:MAG: CZB domain-containing protein [Thiobacillus sp.]